MATSGPIDGQGIAPTEPEKPPAYVFSSLVVMLLCCPPFGIVALVYGLAVQTKWRSGDHRGAMRASDMAEKWMYAGVGAGFLIAVGTFIWWFFVGRNDGIIAMAQLFA